MNVSRDLWTGLRKAAVLAAMLAALTFPVRIAAHEGHAHTVRGTVAERTDTQVSIRQSDGKVVVVKLNAKTTLLKGEQKADAAALTVGQRVIADVGDGKQPFVARSVKLGVTK